MSLGAGGTITLQFTDNALTGSGSTNLDIWVFEIGVDIEDTFIEISEDGIAWSTVGNVTGATSGIDIDAYGFGPSDRFAYVRLTDDPLEGGTGCCFTIGADIDAVGAISSVSVPPSITLQPQDVVTVPSADATFAVVAQGTPPLSYRWKFNSTNLPNANGTSLMISNVSAEMAGDYSVTITNDFGSVNSDTATLVVVRGVVLTIETAIAWPGLATQAGYILGEATDASGPWEPSSVAPGHFADKRLILIAKDGEPEKFYRLSHP